MTVGEATFAEFALATQYRGRLTLTHKLVFGVLDLRVGGITKAELERRVGTSPVKVPDGWSVQSQKKARKHPITMEPAPVMRFAMAPPESGQLHFAGKCLDHSLCPRCAAGEIGFPPFESVSSVVETFATAACEVYRWLASGGAALILGEDVSPEPRDTPAVPS